MERLPYSRLLFEQLGKWRRHVITGPVQSGKSLHAFAMLICYYLFEVKVDVIVGLPDLGMAGSKWEKDIKPLIERSRYAEFLPRRGAGSQGGKPTLVSFENGRTLQFMGGGGNDGQRAASTAKVLIITETDKLDEVSASSKEGQNKIDQLEGRVRAHGLNAVISMECTVSKESNATWKGYKAGTASVIMSKCVHCGVYVAPEREHFVGWDAAESKVEAGERAAFSCPACGQLYSESDRVQMNHDSVLVHKGQQVLPDGTITGDVPKTDTLGFRWSAFHNLLMPMALIGMEEWAVAHSEDPIAAEIAIKQQLWALPAGEQKVEKAPLSIGIVRGSAPGYHGRVNGREMWRVPDWSQSITAHVDVGMRVLNWSVNAHGPRGIRDVIAYGATATEQPDIIGPQEAILTGLHRVREEIEKNCDIRLALIDCTYQGNKKQNDPRKVVYEFVLSCGETWQAASGLATWTPKTENDTTQPSLTGAPWYYSLQEYAGHQFWIVSFDPNHFKHMSHGGYMIRPVDDDGNRVSGSVTLYGHDAKAHNDFAVMMNNERFEIDHTTGKHAWKRHGANHYFDTDVGNLVAKSVLESIDLASHQKTAEASVQKTITTPDGRAFFAGAR